MPDEATWADFFDAACVLERLGVIPATGAIAEFGCGYGTFAIPAAQASPHAVHAFDIEPDMVNLVTARARREGLTRLRAEVRDFMVSGTGLESGTVKHALAFNILHIEHPQVLLDEAFRILEPGGSLAVIHWQPNPETPRGPPMNIRPLPTTVSRWAERAGFEDPGSRELGRCAPWHYGLVFKRPG